MNQFPSYRLPGATVRQVLLAILGLPRAQRHRSFREDAHACLRRLHPALWVYGHEHIPRAGPSLLTMNHYSRPGFGAWWLALAVSDVVATDVHWIMAGAWTYPDRLRAHTITPAMRELFSRIARVYGFTAMPPMPPDHRDWAERAMAVRRVIGHVRHSHQPVIGLAPEGGDSPEGTLQWPPSGTGRFVLHLAELGLKVVPVGGYESRGALCLRFGPAYRLEVSSARPARDRDQEVRETVMHHIAAQLPPHLRGRFA